MSDRLAPLLNGKYHAKPSLNTRADPAHSIDGPVRPPPAVEAMRVQVTEPLLPALDDLLPYLREILDRRWVTNHGSYLQELEHELAHFLKVRSVIVVTNGTIGLDLALRAASVGGEVITTAYSFPATYHVLLNQPQITPVFVDIDEHYGINPEAVEAAITPRTEAILAVHTYGYPCDTAALEKIAAKYHLHLIYDAAHAFAVTINGQSIAEFGDLSLFSFHATKVFTTLEGGCLSGPSGAKQLLERAASLRNFGLANEREVTHYGLNGKMDEVRAAFGLSTLPRVLGAIAARRRVVDYYLRYFAARAFAEVRVCTDIYEDPKLSLNYAYFPIAIEATPHFDRERVYRYLRQHGIGVRRYFYPTILDSPIYEGLYDPNALPQTREAARDVLCLPVHHRLSDTLLATICDLLDHALGQNGRIPKVQSEYRTRPSTKSSVRDLPRSS